MPRTRIKHRVGKVGTPKLVALFTGFMLVLSSAGIAQEWPEPESVVNSFATELTYYDGTDLSNYLDAQLQYLSPNDNGSLCTTVRENTIEALQDNIARMGYDFVPAISDLKCWIEDGDGARRPARILHLIARRNGLAQINGIDLVELLLEDGQQAVFVELVRETENQPNLLTEIHDGYDYLGTIDRVDRQKQLYKFGRLLCRRIQKYNVGGLADILAACVLPPFNYVFRVP